MSMRGGNGAEDDQHPREWFFEHKNGEYGQLSDKPPYVRDTSMELVHVIEYFAYQALKREVADLNMYRKLRTADCMYINQLSEELEKSQEEVARLKQLDLPNVVMEREDLWLENAKLKLKLNKLFRVAIAYQRRTGGGLSGQAFTDFICLRCDQESSWPNTNTPIICDSCVKQIVTEMNGSPQK